MAALSQLPAQAVGARASAQRAPARCSAQFAVRSLRAPTAALRLASLSPAGAGRASRPARRQRCGGVTRAAAEGATTSVITIDSAAAYDSHLASTPADKLLVVECSATWCGPCKMFKPAYEQFATAYEKQAVFTTIMGDANDDCKLLMTRMNVKSVPAFFFYRGGKEVSAFTGANKTAFRNQLVAAGITL